MSYVLFRDTPGTEYRFYGDQWYFFRVTMRQHGWEPKGTEFHDVHPVVGMQHGSPKDSYCVIPVSEIEAAGYSPEDLARHGAEFNRLDHGALLQSYREQWAKGEVLIPTYIDARWDGSYALNSGQLVTDEDARNMSQALARAADDMEATGPHHFPDDWPVEHLRGVTPMLVLRDNDDLDSFRYGVEALREFAAWTALGSFRLF